MLLVTRIESITKRRLLLTRINTQTVAGNSICNALDMSESLFATGHQDRAVRIWDLRTGTLARAVEDAHTSAVSSVEFCQGRSGRILTCSRDNNLCLLEVGTGKVSRRFTHPEFKSPFNWAHASMSPGGRFVAAGGGDGVCCFC